MKQHRKPRKQPRVCPTCGGRGCMDCNYEQVIYVAPDDVLYVDQRVPAKRDKYRNGGSHA